MTSRRTQHEPILTLQLTDTSVHMSSRRSNHTNIGSTNWMDVPLCKLIYLRIGRPNVHRDHNTLPPLKVQLFTSTWSSNQLLLPILEKPNAPNSFIWVASPNGCAYVAAYVPCPRVQAIHSSLNELRQAQEAVTISSAANQTGWVIWSSLRIPSWRITTFNYSLSRSPTWDSCFFTHFRVNHLEGGWIGDELI